MNGFGTKILEERDGASPKYQKDLKGLAKLSFILISTTVKSSHFNAYQEYREWFHLLLDKLQKWREGEGEGAALAE